ncbi:MAG: HNH endonuclease [Armatimonadetes bacterium]|nr:HNH endonuclease [Armatimonadota bacterium]
MGEVLVLNQNYEPLNVCSIHRAVTMVLLGKVEIVRHNGRRIGTISGGFEAPSVIRLSYLVKRPLPDIRVSRRAVLARDRYTCQYCGHVSRDLTVDHVVPRRHGGLDTWENLVACCRRCNLHKSDRSPNQANLKLMRKPKRPHFVPYLSLPLYVKALAKEDWREFLPVFDDLEFH